MAYEEFKNSASITGATYPEPTAARAEPSVVGALRNLGEAVHALANASDAYLAARDGFQMAQKRYQECRDVAAKEQEQAGV